MIIQSNPLVEKGPFRLRDQIGRSYTLGDKVVALFRHNRFDWAIRLAHAIQSNKIENGIVGLIFCRLGAIRVAHGVQKTCTSTCFRLAVGVGRLVKTVFEPIASLISPLRKRPPTSHTESKKLVRVHFFDLMWESDAWSKPFFSPSRRSSHH